MFTCEISKIRKELREKEKKGFLKELELWKEEERLKCLRIITDYRTKRNEELQELAIKCADDTKKHEHSYHQNQQTLGIEIAKLEAKEEALAEIVGQDKTTYNNMLKHKDDEIKRLNILLTKLIEAQPSKVVVNTK